MERKEIIEDPKKLELWIGLYGSLISSELEHGSWLWLRPPFPPICYSDPGPTGVSVGWRGLGLEPPNLLALVVVLKYCSVSLLCPEVDSGQRQDPRGVSCVWVEASGNAAGQ